MVYNRYRGFRRSGYLSSKKNYIKYKKVQYKNGIKQEQDKMGKYGKPPTLSKVVSLINSKMSGIVENKLSKNFDATDFILFWNNPNPVWFLTRYVENNQSIFDMGNGTGMYERIGNKYKLKNWIVKGIIGPSTDAVVSRDWQNTFLANGYMGVVSVFIGKRVDGLDLNPTLNDLLQNGSISQTPSGKVQEQLYTINKDKYKILWGKRFKVGLSNITPSNTLTVQANNIYTNVEGIGALPNNDYKIQHNFTINMTKLIGKNATIKFNDADARAFVPASMQGLSMFCKFEPHIYDLAPSERTPYLFWKIHTSTYYEYEDA